MSLMDSEASTTAAGEKQHIKMCVGWGVPSPPTVVKISRGTLAFMKCLDLLGLAATWCDEPGTKRQGIRLFSAQML